MCIRDRAKVANYKELGLNSETAVMFNITSREQVIVNTWYGLSLIHIYRLPLPVSLQNNLRQFPHHISHNQELADEGFKAVCIIDPGVKLDPGYEDVYKRQI